MQLAFWGGGENGPTDIDPNPVPATASREKVCYLCVYCMSMHILLFIQ